MSLRKEFVVRALSGKEQMAALCREYGISRKTGYKWLARFRERGVAALADEPRRPDRSPLATSPEITLEVLRLRDEHPTWGARKLWRLLSRSVPTGRLPAPRTVQRLLDRAGLVRRRRYRKPLPGRPTAAPSALVQAPNDLWTVDFKGWWRTKNGQKAEPLTVRDAFSRYILALVLLRRTDTEQVRLVFEDLFARYGLPKAIQSDNGSPFASTRTLGGLTRLSAWWISSGIQVVRSRPGCPQDNGAHERMHADIRFEIQAHAAPTRAEQQQICDVWRHEFNHVRPTTRSDCGRRRRFTCRARAASAMSSSVASPKDAS